MWLDPTFWYKVFRTPWSLTIWLLFSNKLASRKCQHDAPIRRYKTHFFSFSSRTTSLLRQTSCQMIDFIVSVKRYFFPGGCASRFAAALIAAVSSSCGSSLPVSSIDVRGPKRGVGVVSDPPGTGVPSTEWATEPASVPASVFVCLRSHAATLFSHSSVAFGKPSSARTFSSFRRASCRSTSRTVWSRHTVRLINF